MNEKEVKQHVRDSRTAEKATRDFDNGKYDAPVKLSHEIANALLLGSVVSDRDRHDEEVYNEAYREARRTSK